VPFPGEATRTHASSVRHMPSAESRRSTQARSKGDPPKPPRKTARALADGAPFGPADLFKRAALGILSRSQQDGAREVVQRTFARNATV
jgi:hypothetical protein